MKRRTAAALAAAVAIGGAGVALASMGGDAPGANNVPTTGNRLGSRVVDGPHVVPGPGPQAYAITYRVDGGGRGIVTTELLRVRRPFDARMDAFAGPPPGHGDASVTIETLGRFESHPAGQNSLVLAQPPTSPAFDLRPQAFLQAAVDRGLLQRREHRVIAGRACDTYRSREDLAAGAIMPSRAGDNAWTDTCIDADGLVLESVRVEKRVVLHRRVAMSVDLAPQLDDQLFVTGEQTVPPNKGGGSFRVLDASSRLPGRFWDLNDPPAGFTHQGRYLARPPQPDVYADLTKIGSLIGGVSDVYRSGADVVVVDQGATLQGAKPFAAEATGAPVDLGALGEGELVLALSGSEVRADLGGGQYVRVGGTLAPDQLIAIARSLTPGPGGTLAPTAP
jgi:hypothetical protein